jgi:hypothetical protein
VEPSASSRKIDQGLKASADVSTPVSNRAWNAAPRLGLRLQQCLEPLQIGFDLFLELASQERPRHLK